MALVAEDMINLIICIMVSTQHHMLLHMDLYTLAVIIVCVLASMCWPVGDVVEWRMIFGSIVAKV